MRLKKVISGGQTGADRAGLDAAVEAGIPVGGFCPKGRLAEDGKVPECYPLTELTRGGYPARTEKNVLESDGTLILNMGKLTGGTRRTKELAAKHGKPCLVVQLDKEVKVGEVIAWIGSNKVEVLNVAGPRESKNPGTHERALSFLKDMLKSAAAYPAEKEGLLTPGDAPPTDWSGTWSYSPPYKPDDT